MKLSLGKKIAGVAVAGAVLVGAGTVAWAAGNTGSTTAAINTSSADAATAATAPPASAVRKGTDLLRRADHGTIEIKVKGATKGAATWQTVTFDRGKATAVSASQITLARPDGKTVQLTINASTKYRGVTSWQQVATAKDATVVSENGTATIIGQRVAPAPGTGNTGSAGAPAPGAGSGGTTPTAPSSVA